MERIARGKVKYVGYFESDPIRCASDPIRIFLLAGLSTSAAIVLARYLFVWIETPFMLLGKQISLRLVRLGSLAHRYRSEDDWYRHAKNTPST
jgi:hypothetical protein